MDEQRRTSMGSLKTTGATSVPTCSPCAAEEKNPLATRQLGDLASHMAGVLEEERQIYVTLIDMSEAIGRSLRNRQYETLAANVRRQEQTLDRLAGLEQSRIELSTRLADICSIDRQPVRLRDLYVAFPASLSGLAQQLQDTQPVLVDLVRNLVAANRRNATLLRVALLRSQQVARVQAGVSGITPGYTAAGVIPTMGAWQPVSVDRHG